jgi:GxxExxY protein
MNEDYKYKEITDKIISAFYKVYNSLGYGFLEKVYENALIIELKDRGMMAVPQAQIQVFYKGNTVGEYYADIVVEDKIIVEIKAGRDLAPEHEAQLLNYLKATDMEVGLLLNFGPEPQVKRKLFNNDRKTSKNQQLKR